VANVEVKADVLAAREDRVGLTASLVDTHGRALVFCRTKHGADRLAKKLAREGLKAAVIHGDRTQNQRNQALKGFQDGYYRVLVATDVAARGIDIDDVTHVINYQIPEDEQAYVHRIGRTGRAGKTGVAVTLVDWDELPRWSMIDKALGLDSPHPAETYSSSPHLYDELGIPAEARGTVGTPRKSPVKRRDVHVDSATSETPAKSSRSQSTSRSRRRTRGGQSVTGHPGGSAAATGDTAADAPSDSPSGNPGRRRRRRRKPTESAAAAGAAPAD